MTRVVVRTLVFIVVALGAQRIECAHAQTVRERGEYLVRAANCVSCHTAPGGAVFAGGVPFPTDFGTIYSSNITPDGKTGIGTWTYAQFEAALRRGVRPDGQHLYPAFPYTNFTRLADDDVAALYAYFMNLKPVDARPPANQMHFPFGNRSLLGVWKALFFDEGRFVPRPDRPAQWNRGAYLVNALAHCGACHSPRNLLGAERASQAFTGGVFADLVEDRGTVARAAPNLTPSLQGLGAWSEDDITHYLKQGASTRTRLMGSMNDVVLNSTRHLTEEDDRAIAVYLRSLPPRAAGAGSPDAKVMALGSRQYDIHCGTCHLPSGLGSADNAPPLAGSALAQAPDPASLIDLVINGPRLPPELPSEAWRRPWQSMSPFAQKLSDEEAAALLTFVRNSWGNSAPAVSPRHVGRMR